MKVGRAALDEDAIRRIEELNPFVEFDWPRILKGQDAPPSEPRVPAEVKRQRGSPRPQERSERREAPAPAPAPAQARRSASEGGRDVADVKEALKTEPAPALPAPPEPPAPDVIVAAHARLGADGVARLRARHVEIVARIAERITDPARREELQAQANRLSPDSWIADADVVRALDEYESVFALLREVVGRKRRRRRRGSRNAGSSEDRGLGSSEEQESVESDEPSELPTPRAPEPPALANKVEDGQTNPPPDTSDSREEPEDPGL